VTFDSVGKALKNMTGKQVNIDEYIFGDISSTIYPVEGGLEDWAYGAGWDHADFAT
jgi:hypothetical protein